MSLLEKLAERQYSLTFEKVAEDVFLDAVLDELQKLGHESISKEMLKRVKELNKEAIKFFNGVRLQTNLFEEKKDGSKG